MVGSGALGIMGSSTAKLLMVLALLTGVEIEAEEGSLRSALNAISKRQQDLGDYPKYSDDFYNDPERYASYIAESGNDLSFLNSPEKTNQDYKDLDRSIYDYSADDNENKRISSAFRERIEEDKSRQKEKFENMVLNDLNEMKNSEENVDYLEFLHELWEKYGRNYPEILNYYTGVRSNKGDIKKRSHPHHYTGLGLDSVGMKKRSYKPSEATDYLYLVNYTPKEEYAISKRFPVTKRSSNYYPIPYTNEFNRHVKRSSKKETPTKTDPKVADDLSSIFDPEHKHRSTEKPVTKPKRTEHVTETETKKPQVTTSSTTTTSSSPSTKRSEKAEDKPIQLKKKSIEWSDYFGIDRKKKSNNLDNEWLMERYHKAVAMATKRDSESIQETNERPRTNSKTTEEKINEMDAKLKNIEYAIVDDALKFTGAHEGAVDSKEIQEVKDRVISQLATAYSLEKMRRALEEYRKSILKERNRMRDDSDKIDEKRLSVPRKSAEMEKEIDDEEIDNNIKCTDESCNKDGYGEVFDGGNLEYCPKIRRVCGEVSMVLGRYGKIFESACAMHQMCLLCADNSWFSPTRQCNMLFLNKTDYLCNDDVECREVARHSVRYLLDVNHLLRTEPLDTCELVC